MPIYDYRCNDCGTAFDIFHKVREVIEDVVCPSCRSMNHTRLLSAPNFTMNTEGSARPNDFSAPSCADGSCCGGACDVN